MEPIYTPDEVACLLKLEVREVNELIEEGHLKVVRLGKQVRVRESDLQACLDHSAPPTSDFVLEAGIRLCGAFGGRATFRVHGSVEGGARIWPGTKASSPVKCSKEFFEAMLKKYRGQTIRVGLSFSDPGEGSLGAYVQRELKTKMNPTTYIAGLLVNEGYAERSEAGYIRFFNRRKGSGNTKDGSPR